MRRGYDDSIRKRNWSARSLIRVMIKLKLLWKQIHFRVTLANVTYGSCPSYLLAPHSNILCVPCMG